jgi:hypothetical protein
MSCVPFHGQRTRLSREEVIETYISLRLCTEDIMRLSFRRVNFQRLMTDLIAEELNAIPELPEKLTELGVAHHPAFASVASALGSGYGVGSAFLSCEVLD